MPKCESCKYLISTSYEYGEYECKAGVLEDEIVDFPDGESGCKKHWKTLEKQYKENQKAKEEYYAGFANWYEKIAKAESRCNRCIWCMEEKYKRTERPDGRFVTNWCRNVGSAGWGYWEIEEIPPEECRQYCPKGEA